MRLFRSFFLNDALLKPYSVHTCQQGRIQPVRLGGMISVIFGS